MQGECLLTVEQVVLTLKYNLSVCGTRGYH